MLNEKLRIPEDEAITQERIGLIQAEIESHLRECSKQVVIDQLKKVWGGSSIHQSDMIESPSDAMYYVSMGRCNDYSHEVVRRLLNKYPNIFLRGFNLKGAPKIGRKVKGSGFTHDPGDPERPWKFHHFGTVQDDRDQFYGFCSANFNPDDPQRIKEVITAPNSKLFMNKLTHYAGGRWPSASLLEKSITGADFEREPIVVEHPWFEELYWREIQKALSNPHAGYFGDV